jgi:hypothetical protein
MEFDFRVEERPFNGRERGSIRNLGLLAPVSGEGDSVTITITAIPRPSINLVSKDRYSGTNLRRILCWGEAGDSRRY